MIIDDFYKAENWLYEEWERRVDAHEDAGDVTGRVRTTSGEFVGSFSDSESDADIYEWLQRQDGKAAYIRRLIREDMERHAED